ncbi:MAG: hypothetical protein ACKO5P_07635 [Nodosilinea sp.]
MARGTLGPPDRSQPFHSHAYPCPVCWRGRLQPMVLMEAYSCDLCQQILAINSEQQALYRLDISPAQGWRWQGQRWRSLHSPAPQTTLTLALISLILVVFPAGLVALAAYLFPPLDPTGRITWTWGWAGLTLILHSLMVAWLGAEVYQWPAYRLMQIGLNQIYRSLGMEP